MKKAEATRKHILEQAFALIYEKGYQNTSIDDIIAKTELTKGAFYYHFQNKDAMGLAIINEVLNPALANSFSGPLQKEDDPLLLIYNLIHRLLMKDDFMKAEFGCPVSNLTQEMSPWHTDFTEALKALTDEWKKMLAKLVSYGQKQGRVRKEVQPNQVAVFVMSGYWGARNFGKLGNSKVVYRTFLSALKEYLDALR